MLSRVLNCENQSVTSDQLSSHKRRVQQIPIRTRRAYSHGTLIYWIGHCEAGKKIADRILAERNRKKKRRSVQCAVTLNLVVYRKLPVFT